MTPLATPHTSPPKPDPPATPGPRPRPAKKLRSVQACRAVAAGLVVCAHDSVSIFGRPRYFPANPVGHLLDFGHVGVEFFFVLSGFIILTVHAGDIGKPQSLGAFLRKRFVRIYPIYWLILAGLLLIYFAHPSFGEGFEREPAIIASSFALIGGWRLSATLQPVTILPAAWTLYYEIAFYALFLTLIASRRWGLAVFATWFALCLLDLTLGPARGAAALYLSPRNLLFGFGMAAAWLSRHRSIPAPAAWAVLGLALFFGSGLSELRPGWLAPDTRSLLCGLGSMIGLIGLVALERSARLAVPNVLVLLGEASYAIYLVHLAVLVLLAKLVAALPHPPAWSETYGLLLYGGFLVAAMLAGLLVHLAVERPLLRALGRRWHAIPGVVQQV